MCENTIQPKYIYLVQEREFIKTKENIFKVGMTEKENHKRFNQYPKGSLLLCQIICNNCKRTEKDIIKKFIELFKQRKDIGKEYFEGDYKSMINIIYSTIQEETDTENDAAEEEKEEEDDDIREWELDNFNFNNWESKHIERVRSKEYQEEAFQKVCEKIQNVFPDYKKDVVFGGEKTFFKVVIESDKSIIVHYINPQLKSLVFDKLGNAIYYSEYYEIDPRHFEFRIICEDNISHYLNTSGLHVFTTLVRDEIIISNTIYDLNSEKFLTKVSRPKVKIHIEYYDDFINTHKTENNDIFLKIFKILTSNAVLNNKTYVAIDEDNLHLISSSKSFIKLELEIINSQKSLLSGDSKSITLIKINKKYFDVESFFEKYFPYRVKWSEDNNFFILNRNKEYIGLNTKYIGYKLREERICDKGDTPWESKKEYTKYCFRYVKCIKENKLNDCLNSHRNSNAVLHLLD